MAHAQNGDFKLKISGNLEVKSEILLEILKSPEDFAQWRTPGVFDKRGVYRRRDRQFYVCRIYRGRDSKRYRYRSQRAVLSVLHALSNLVISYKAVSSDRAAAVGSTTTVQASHSGADPIQTDYGGAPAFTNLSFTA